MWKLKFEYEKSTLTLTGNQKEISLDQAIKCKIEFGLLAKNSIYQQYPKEEHKAVSLNEKISELTNRVPLRTKCYVCHFPLKKSYNYFLYQNGRFVIRTVCKKCYENIEEKKEIDRKYEQARIKGMFSGN